MSRSPDRHQPSGGRRGGAASFLMVGPIGRGLVFSDETASLIDRGGAIMSRDGSGRAWSIVPPHSARAAARHLAVAVAGHEVPPPVFSRCLLYREDRNAAAWRQVYGIDLQRIGQSVIHSIPGALTRGSRRGGSGLHEMVERSPRNVPPKPHASVPPQFGRKIVNYYLSLRTGSNVEPAGESTRCGRAMLAAPPPAEA